MVRQGDIFMVNFNPSKGHEQLAQRPAIALSNDLVAETSNMTIVAPISSTSRHYPMYHRLQTTTKVYGQILLDQTIALDLHALGVDDDSVVEQISRQELKDIIYQYRLLFDID